MTFNVSDILDGGASSGGATTSIINKYSSGGTSDNGMDNIAARAKTTQTGSLTATVLSAALINISGTAGIMTDLCLYLSGGVPKTLRLQVMADGNTIFDATSNSISAIGTGIYACSSGTVNNVSITAPIVWQSTLQVKVASSVTETNQSIIAYNYQTRA